MSRRPLGGAAGAKPQGQGLRAGQADGITGSKTACHIHCMSTSRSGPQSHHGPGHILRQGDPLLTM